MMEYSKSLPLTDQDTELGSWQFLFFRWRGFTALEGFDNRITLMLAQKGRKSAVESRWVRQGFLNEASIEGGAFGYCVWSLI